MNKEFKPNPQVLARIAEALLQNNTIKKTHLHFASRTDWHSFEKYLNWLQSKNYVIYHDDIHEHTYTLSYSGRIILTNVLSLHDSIKKFQSIINV